MAQTAIRYCDCSTRRRRRRSSARCVTAAITSWRCTLRIFRVSWKGWLPEMGGPRRHGPGRRPLLSAAGAAGYDFRSLEPRARSPHRAGLVFEVTLAGTAPMSSLTRQVVVTVLLLGAVLGLFVAAQSGQRRLEDAGRRVELGAQRQRALSDVSQLLRQAESSQRGYILVGDPDYLIPFQEASARISEAEVRLDNAYAKAPAALRADVGEVTRLSEAKFAELRATLERFRVRGRAAAVALIRIDAGVRTMTQIEQLVNSMQAEETAEVLAASHSWRISRWVRS